MVKTVFVIGRCFDPRNLPPRPPSDGGGGAATAVVVEGAAGVWCFDLKDAVNDFDVATLLDEVFTVEEDTSSLSSSLSRFALIGPEVLRVNLRRLKDGIFVIEYIIDIWVFIGLLSFLRVDITAQYNPNWKFPEQSVPSLPRRKWCRRRSWTTILLVLWRRSSSMEEGRAYGRSSIFCCHRHRHTPPKER